MKNGLYSGITPKANMLKGKTLKMPPNRASKKSKGQKTRLFHRIYNDDIDNNIIAKVGTTAWAVYSVIKRHKNWNTNTAFPSFETIKQKTGIAKNKTIHDAIFKLQDNGLLTLDKRKHRKPTGEEYGRPKYFYTLPKEKKFY